jgi:alkylation response protein AidB-like acyl-CoA dehydrogenase
MQFEHTEKVKALIARLEAFFTDHIYPNEQAVSQLVHSREGKERWEALPVVEQLKPKARSAGLWNMFLPHSGSGAGLTNLEYAPLCEIMGRVVWSSEVFNCSAPDTGNMAQLSTWPGSFRLAREQGTLAQAALERRDPLGVLRDAAGGRVFGRDQYRDQHSPRRLGHIAASARTMRIVDGPDEVHRNRIGKMELQRYRT